MAKDDFVAAMQQETKAEQPVVNTPNEVKKSAILERSRSFAAEHSVNTLATIILVIGIIVGGILFFLGIGAAIEVSHDRYAMFNYGYVLMFIGFLIFFVHLIAWALLRLQVNISYRLTKIDMQLEKLNAEK